MKHAAPFLALSLLAALPVAAQDASQVSGPVPAPDAAPTVTPICTDRPTKATAACTVPAGAVQVEADLLNWTRLSMPGARTDSVLYTNPTVKLGVGTHTDLEANIAPYETVRSRDGSGVTTLGGVGDLYLRVKQRLSADSSKTQVSLVPYVKAPTARIGIGNRAWEGGAVLAASIPLPSNFTLTAAPEVDILLDGDGSGRHAAFTMATNLAHPLGSKVTLYGELWTQQNFDPARTVRQYSADAAAAYLLTPTLQLDLGINVGLNRATPDTQVYAGIAKRF